MLVQSASPAMIVEPHPVTSPEPAAPANGRSSPVNAAALFAEGDDEDEALQAILLASLQEQAGVAEASAPEVSRAASEEQESRFNAAVKPALVGKPSPLAEFAKQGSFCAGVQQSLEALGAAPHHLMLARVRGDGHCLFRVVGCALLLGASWGGREAVDALVRHLSSPELHASASEVARLMTELLAAPSDGLLAALNDEADGAVGSSQLVAALRRCAVDYMRAHGERFRYCGGQPDSACAKATEGGEPKSAAAAAAASNSEEDEAAVLEAHWAEYCVSMADSSQARYGGHPELVALSEALRIRVDVHDTGAASGGNMATYRLGEGLPDTVPVVRGLRAGLHYNLLLAATAEGEEMADATSMSVSAD
jgi:hypothetical protein